jgi:hypothetical protein
MSSKLFTFQKDVTPATAKVGEAAYNILKKDQYAQEVGDTLNEMAPKYLEELRSCCESNKNNFEAPFYIVVLGKKEPYALNVVRHWYVARQTKPNSQVLLTDYPNHFHEVFEYDDRTGDCKMLWCLTANWNHDEILGKPQTYDPSLVQWHLDHYEGKLK